MIGYLRRVGRLLAILLCLIAAGVILIAAGLPDRARVNAYYPITPGDLPVAPEEGAMAMPISLPDITSGDMLSLSAWRGQPVIINFWATWCGPCEAETPLLEEAYKRYQDKGLKIIGMDVGENIYDVRSWRSRQGVTYNLAIDRDGRLISLYKVRGLPTTFFIGRDGVIKQIQYGPVNAAGLDSAIQALLR